MYAEPGGRATVNACSASTTADRAKGTEDALESILGEQRQDWIAGKPTPAAEWLRRYPALAADSAQAAELVYHEYVLRAELGESPSWQDYLQEFPEHADLLKLLREADEIVEQALAPSELAGCFASEISDYELLEEIGRGGMGVVFKARQKSLDRIVALKMLRGGEYSDRDERARFQSEAQALARLQHANIVQIYEAGETGGQSFLSVEFVDGRSLANYLDGTPMPPRPAAALMEVLARAMHYAHERGIIHRDLKPSNILLQPPAEVRRHGDKEQSRQTDKEAGRQGDKGDSARAVSLSDFHPKITDFGVAKRLDTASDTRSGAVLGTPSYMAPEQAAGATVAIDRRTDVYGLGAILYELLTGRPPFRAESPLQTLNQVMEVEPARPRLLNEGVPRDLETVCLKCLQKEPSHRYASAAALADDLRRFVNGEPVHARPLGVVGRGWRWCRRNLVMATLAVVLALAVAAGFSGILYQWRRAEAARRDVAAGDAEVRELLSELIQSSPVVPLMLEYYPGAPSIEPLLKAEAHCKSLIERDPRDMAMRIALTNVYGRLGTLYVQRDHRMEATTSFRNARMLWESLPPAANSAEGRDWLATTQYWQAYAMLVDSEELPEKLRLIQSADALWQELAEARPGDLALLEKMTRNICQTLHLICGQAGGGECKRSLESSKDLLGQRVRDDPGNRVLRKRLALTCLFLGDFCRQEQAARQARSHWQDAYKHYRSLANARSDDLIVNLLLGFSCSRLIEEQPEDPYYVQAVAHLQQTGARLATLLEQHPGSYWLYEAQLENYCCLATCHSKAGQKTLAEATCREHVQPIVTALIGRRADPEHALSVVTTLCQLASALRDAKLAATGLPIARQAAVLTSRYAALPSRDLGLLVRLGECSENLSAVLNQLKDPASSLQQAELVRRLFEEASRAAPRDLRCRATLKTAWMRIGKARWDLGQADEALAAFRESARIQRQIFEAEPSNHAQRVALDRCYSRLVHWGTLKGDWAGVAAALWEREKLWPDDAEKLREISDDFRELAQKAAHGNKQLSAKEQADHQLYLAESKRTAQAAEAVARRTGNARQAATAAVRP
jgi:predicted Ser/Thr protein kinase